MSRTLRSDNATAADASWDFLENADLVDALRNQARKWHRGMGGEDPAIDAEDLFQEAVLWLGVRPELHDRPVGHILNHTRGRLRDVLERKRLDITDIDEADAWNF